MEGRRPSLARSSRSPSLPRRGERRGTGPPSPIASSRKRSPKPSPRRVEDFPAPFQIPALRHPSEDDLGTASPTSLLPTGASERVALVQAPRRPLRVAAVATSRRQPLPTPREHRERICSSRQPSEAPSSPPKKRAFSQQRPDAWFRRDMGDSAFVAASARESVEVDKSTAALLFGAAADDRPASPSTAEAQPVPASRAPRRPQVAAERRGKRPVPRSIKVYVDIQKSGKESREDKNASLGTGTRESPIPINEGSEMFPRRNGADSEVSLTVDTSIQHERRTSLLQNISTSISTVLSRFFRNGPEAGRPPEPAPRAGQAMPIESKEDIDATVNVGLGANDQTAVSGRQGENTVRSQYHLDRYRGLVASGISLTQIISVRRRTEARKPLGPRHTDKQGQPSRRGMAEPEISPAKPPVVAELPAAPSASKPEPEESPDKLLEVVERPPERADRASMQLVRSKAEFKGSFAELPEVVEASAEMQYREQAKERRLSHKGTTRDQEETVAEKLHVSEVPEVKARKKSVGGKDREKQGSIKDAEVSETSATTKRRRESKSTAKSRRRKSKASASESDVTEKTMFEGTEKSDARSTEKKLKRKGSTGPATKASMTKKDVKESSSDAAEGGKVKSHKGKRKKSRDITEKTVADDSEHSSIRKTGKSRRKSSTVDDGKKGKSRKGSVKKGDMEEHVTLDSKGAEGSSKSAGAGKKYAPGKDSPEDGVKSPEESGKSILRTKSKTQVIPFDQRLSTKSASQRLAAALGKEDSVAPLKNERDVSDTRPGSAEEVDTKRSTSLSSLAAPSQREGKKQGAETSTSEDKRKKRRSKSEGSAGSQGTGSNREDSAMVKKVAGTTGSKTALGQRRTSAKERPPKSKKRSGSRSSRRESSPDSEKQPAANKETEQVLASVGEHEHALEVREEPAVVASPPEGGLVARKAEDKVVDAESEEQKRRRSRQGGKASADKNLEPQGPDGTPQGGPSKVGAPADEDNEPGRRRKSSSKAEASRQVPQGDDGDEKTQESGSPEGGKQKNAKSPEGKRGKAKGKAKEKSKGHAHKHKHKHDKKKHGHVHHKHKKRSRKESGETATRCVETQTCLAAPVVEKGGASCRDFNFGVNLSPVVRGTLQRPSDRKQAGDTVPSPTDVPEATKTASESPKPKSLPADGSDSKGRSRKPKKSKSSKVAKERRKETPSTAQSKVVGTLLDVKPEATPEEDKPLTPKEGGSDLCKCLPFFFDKSHKPEPAADVTRTQLRSDEGTKDVDSSPKERVREQSPEKEKPKKHKSSKGSKKRSKHGRKKDKKGAHPGVEEVGESVPFRFQWSPRENRPLSWSTMRVGMETPLLLSPGEDIKPDGAAVMVGEGKTGKESAGPSKGGRRSKKRKGKPSKRGGKDSKTSPQSGSSKHKSKRRRGKKSSSKDKGREKQSPEDGSPLSPPVGLSPKEADDEKAAAIEPTGVEGGREVDIGVSRLPDTKGTFGQRELVPPAESKKQKGKGRKSKESKSRRSGSSKKKDKTHRGKRSSSKKKADENQSAEIGGQAISPEGPPKEMDGEKVAADVSSSPVTGVTLGQQELVPPAKSKRKSDKSRKSKKRRSKGSKKRKGKVDRGGRGKGSSEKKAAEDDGQATSPEAPAKEMDDEKAATVQPLGEQDGPKADTEVSRFPPQQESAPPAESKKKRGKSRKSKKSKSRRSESSKRRRKKDKAGRESPRRDRGASPTKELLPSGRRMKEKKLSGADSAVKGDRDFEFEMRSRPVVSGKYGRREPDAERGQPEPKVSVSKGGKRARDKKDKHGKRHGSRKSHGRRSKKSSKREKADKKRSRGGDLEDARKSPSSSTPQASPTSTEGRMTPEKKADDEHSAAAGEGTSGGGSCDFDFVIGIRPLTRGTLPRPDLTQVSEPAIVEAFESCQGAFHVRGVSGRDELATRADSESPSAGDWERSVKYRERKSRRHRTRSDSRRSRSKSSRRSKSKGGRPRSSKQSKSRRSTRSSKTSSKHSGSKKGRKKHRSRSKKSSSRGKKRDKRRRRHRKDSRRRRRRHDRGGRRRRGRSRSARRRKIIRRLLAEEASRPSQTPALCCLLVTLLAFTAVLTLCVGVLYYYIIIVKPRHTTPETTTYTVIFDTSPKHTTRWTGGPTTRTTKSSRTHRPPRTHPPPPVPPTTGVYYCSTDYCNREAHYIGSILAGEMNPCDNFYQHVCARWKRHYFSEVPKHASFVSQETLLEERLAAQFSQGDLRVASKLYGACSDRQHQGDVSNRTMQAVFKRWTIQEWPRTSPPPGGTLAIWRFAAELVRDLGLATIVGASVGVNPEDLNVTLVELYRPRLLLHEARVDSEVVRRFFTEAVKEATAYHLGEFTSGLNETLFKVHSALATLRYPSFDASSDGEDLVVRQVGQLGQGLGQFLQVLLADVRSQVSRSERVLIRSKHYLLDQLDDKLNAVPPLDALNYMGLLVYIHVSPFFHPFVPRLRSLFAETITGYTMSDRDSQRPRVCARLAVWALPDCFAKVSQQWRQAANQDVSAREWLSQLESVFLRHVADFIWMNELSSLLVRYRLKRSVATQFGQLSGRQCAPTGGLSTENALLFFLNVTKRVQEQVFEGLLVNSSMLRQRLAAAHSDLAGAATFERAFRTIHVPAALFNVSVPTNSSVFVFQLARVAVRLYRGIVQLLDDNPYEHETPLGLTEELRRRRTDLVSCFARDALRNLPVRFGATSGAEGHLGRTFLERTSALLLSARAFDELLSVRRIWQMDLRLKNLPHVSARQLFFIYFALDNCAEGDESVHWTRLPAEQLVNVPLRHTNHFAEAFNCRGGQDRMAASPGSEFCEVFRRHPRERRAWEARRSLYAPINGTPMAEGA
ncbi:hypothetical protein HPB50_020457 [Hyalomma asiaticum]|uniref:Uncharacterized protein n=1 Tax=Hyalomma asiaticum TaxID=266040 RepID=A0ACB7T222_HYAAI|nr:hypothetical protein HPB50_020457 [Hyalomma asiaticum]